MRDLFLNAKNTAVSLALKTYLNERFGRSLHVSDCALDTAQNTLHLNGSLHRLPVPVRLSVERYRVEQADDEHFVVIQRIRSSFAPLGWYAQWRYARRRYEIPTSIAKLL